MSQLQQAGSQGQYVPIFTDRFFLGLVTNRNRLRSPLGAYYSKFITSNDALIDGNNTEISNRLTLIRRPGNTAGLTSYLSSANISGIPLDFYSFHEIGGMVRVFIDTTDNIYLLSANVVSTVYTKLSSVGQSYFQGVGQALYFSDLVEQGKWLDFGAGIPGNSFSAITATSLTSNVATITAINNFAVGQRVTISNTTNGSGVFNTTATITAVTSANFQFALTSGNVSSTSDSGTASATWNWGIAAPTIAPTLVVTQTGSDAIPWAASTWFSTMGILIDSHGSAQQLVSVNADGSNPSSQFGLSGPGGPPWNQTTLATTNDGTVQWQNKGPIGSWVASATYTPFFSGSSGSVAHPAIIYDEQSGGFYIYDGNGTAVGTVKPAFNGIVGGSFPAGGNIFAQWRCVLNAFNPSNLADARYGSTTYTWKPNQAYFWNGSVFTPYGLLVEPYGPPPLGQKFPSNQTVYLQLAFTSGTSQATPYTPWGASVIPSGVQTIDKQLRWVSLGSATWAANTQYTGWTAANVPAFSCVTDTAGGLQVCVQSGKSGSSAPWIVWQASHAYVVGDTITDTNGNLQTVTVAGTSGTPTHPSWNTVFGGTTSDNTITWSNAGDAYGTTTIDGTVTWAHVGLAAGAAWTASQSYYLPKSGFSPPNPFNKYGGADIIDSNSNVEFVIDTGVSGGSAPSWNATIGGDTTDNTVKWFNNGPITTTGISWTTGYGYVYSFKARSTSDRFLSASTVPLGRSVLPAPTGSADGSVSTASPAASFQTSNAGAIITVSGFGSTDPQVDTIEIFRTADGGSTYFLLADIAAPPPIGGVAQPWSYQDSTPDNATATSDGLIDIVVAPLAHFNDPPPAGLINIVEHLGRIFGSVGSVVYCSEGPLVGGSSQPPGNGFTAFNVSQFWSFPSPVTKLVTTSTGLFVFTTSDLFIISGGPSVSSLFSNILIPGLGLSSFNALTVSGSIIMLLTSDNQCVSLDPSMGVSEIGVGIGDKINAISPTSAYLTYLIQGSNDKALYVANGSTGWYRCNPNQSPDSPITGPVWSPFATIAGGGGCGAIAALEYSPGKHALLIGSASTNKPILVRDSTYTTFTDNSVAYKADATVGSIVLADPGELAELGFITCDFVKTGTSPIVSVLLDEIQDSLLSITAASRSGSNTTYTYTLTSGIALISGMTISITGFSHSGNNGTFVITGLGGGTFTVVNASGFTESGQTAVGTQFEPLNGYIGSTGIPPQDPPLKYGLSLQPNSVYANRYFFLQSINGTAPQPACCRHMQIKIDYQSDTVQNEDLSMSIWGKHWSESYA